MFDAYLRPIIDKPLTKMAVLVVRGGISANAITWMGFGLGMMGAYALYSQSFETALFLILLNRVMDGLDGAVARLNGPTDYGGYLDIVLDFIFYSAVPFSFVALNPTEFGLAGAFLIFSFIGTGGSFLAYAILAEKRKISTEIRGQKSFYYLGGLTEGTETIILFICLCLWPVHFSTFAWIFGGACWVTTCIRILAAKKMFK